jgi:hypothetical protein
MRYSIVYEKFIAEKNRLKGANYGEKAFNG